MNSIASSLRPWRHFAASARFGKEHIPARKMNSDWSNEKNLLIDGGSPFGMIRIESDYPDDSFYYQVFGAARLGPGFSCAFCPVQTL